MLALLSPEALCARLGERVRTLRLARNVSQRELAAMAGASLSSIRRLEAQGQGSMELLVRVALALNAAATLEGMLLQPTQTIAQLEAQARVRKRARNTPSARAPRSAAGA